MLVMYLNANNHTGIHIAAGKAYTFSSARAYIFKPECQTVSGIKNIYY